MNKILGRALIAAAALSIPALASAEQASEPAPALRGGATPLCDHEKMEEKAPTAEKSESKDSNKAKKTDDKSNEKQQQKDSNKS